MSKPATLQTVAENLGLSKTTVSVALRGRPGVSETMRARILAEAKRVGYQPNTAQAELMAIVRARRRAKGTETIAFINTFQQDPSLLRRVRGFRMFLEGAIEQGKEFGYRVEEFRVADYGPTSKRLDQVLKSRGIRGILLGPRHMDEPEISLDWSAYSCVLVGESTYGARIHRVCNHHPQTMELALTSMAALGYQRIGVELMADYESVRHFDFLAGVEPARLEFGEAVKVFVRIKPSHPVPGMEPIPPERRNEFWKNYSNSHELPLLEQWVRQERLDGLVTLHAYDKEGIKLIRTAIGRPLGYAELDTHITEGCAGINEHSDDIGRTAVHLLRGLLHAGEKGSAPMPRIVLIEGEWIDGPTAPRIDP